MNQDRLEDFPSDQIEVTVLDAPCARSMPDPDGKPSTLEDYQKLIIARESKPEQEALEVTQLIEKMRGEEGRGGRRGRFAATRGNRAQRTVSAKSDEQVVSSPEVIAIDQQKSPTRSEPSTSSGTARKVLQRSASSKLARGSRPICKKAPSEGNLLKTDFDVSRLEETVEQLYEKVNQLETILAENQVETSHKIMNSEEAILKVVNEQAMVTNKKLDLLFDRLSNHSVDEMTEKLTVAFRVWQEENKAVVRTIERSIGVLKAGFVATLKDIGREPPPALTAVESVSMADLHLAKSQTTDPLLKPMLPKTEVSTIRARMASMRKFFDIKPITWDKLTSETRKALLSNDTAGAQAHLESVKIALEEEKQIKFDE